MKPESKLILAYCQRPFNIIQNTVPSSTHNLFTPSLFVTPLVKGDSVYAHVGEKRKLTKRKRKMKGKKVREKKVKKKEKEKN